MYRIIVFNKMNNVERIDYTKDVKEAIAKARRIAKATAKKKANGQWSKLQTSNK